MTRPLQGCGTYAAYVRGCRCDECREARRAYHESWRRAKGVRPRAATHPSLSAYKNRGCRCDECRAFNAAAVRRWRHKKKAEGD